jgi:hypothetical protein
MGGVTIFVLFDVNVNVNVNVNVIGFRCGLDLNNKAQLLKLFSEKLVLAPLYLKKF